MFDASNYSVLSRHEVVSLAPQSKLFGNCGYTNSITGSSNVTVLGFSYSGLDVDSPLISSDIDYNNITTQEPNNTVTYSNLGGITFVPGITQCTSYDVVIGDDVTVNNTITFDGSGFYFITIPNGGLRTITSLASVDYVLLNGASATQVFWYVGGNVHLTSSTEFRTIWIGTILTPANITCENATITKGSLIALGSESVITISGSEITCMAYQSQLESLSDGYAVVQSNLADSKAVQIHALNTYGGIYMTSGSGGIQINTNNSFNVESKNASSVVVKNAGNLNLRAEAGLLNLDGHSGINIGTNTTHLAPSVNIGNTSTSSAVNIQAGSGGINLVTNSGPLLLESNASSSSHVTVHANADGQDLTLALTGAYDSSIILSSTGTGSDAINLNTSTGGINVYSAQKLALTSASTASDSLTLNTAGKLSLSATKNAAISAPEGVLIDSSTGWGSVMLQSGSAGLVLNAYNGGVIGIANWNNAEIRVGTAAGAQPITLGNTTATATTIRRGSTAPLLETQPPETNLGTVGASVTLTAPQVISGIIVVAGAGLSSDVVMPTRSSLLSALSTAAGPLGLQINDSIQFSIINDAMVSISLQSNSSDTSPSNSLIGSTAIVAASSALFKLRLVDTTTGAYVLYRLA